MSEGFHAPLDTHHKLSIDEQGIEIVPALARMVVARAIALAFAGLILYAVVHNVLRGVHGAEAAILAVVGLFGLIILAGALAPFRTLHARIDFMGLDLKGRAAPEVGYVPWTRVTHVVKDHKTRSSPRRRDSHSWSIGVVLDDDTVVGLLRVQNERRANELAAALERYRAS